MKLALDTSAYRELQEGNPQLSEAIRRSGTVGLPIIVVGELRFGFMNGTRLHENTVILERFIASPRVQILQLDDQTTRQFGEIATLLRKAGVSIQQDDIWIAALCKQYDFSLATRDRGFHHVLGLNVLEL